MISDCLIRVMGIGFLCFFMGLSFHTWFAKSELNEGEEK